MNKREFLQKLREYLSYELPQRYVEKNLRYYNDYIDKEAKKGRTQRDILDDLGDPQLIAKSIIDAAKSGSDGIPNTADDIDFTEEIYGREGGPDIGSDSTGGFGSSTYGSGSYADQDRGSSFGSDSTGNTGDFNNPAGGWHVYTGNGCFVGIVIFLVIFCLFSVIGAVIGFLSPVLAPLFIVLLIVWLLGRRR